MSGGRLVTVFAVLLLGCLFAWLGSSRGYHKLGWGLAIVAWILGLGIVGLVEHILPSRPSLPAPTGPFAVGRIDVGSPSPRSLVRRTLLYYPARSNPGGSRGATYLVDASTPARALGLPRAVLAHLEELSVQIEPGAAAAPSERPWIVYVHGAMGFPEEQSVLCSELASRGFVVLAPQLELGERLQDLSRARTEEAIVAALDLFESEHLAEVVTDLYALLERTADAEAWPTGGRPPAQEVIFIGYSLGGGIAGGLARRAEDGGLNVRAWINLDGHPMGPLPRATAELHLSQSLGFTPGSESIVMRDYASRIERARAGTRGPTQWLRLLGAGHGSFTDLPYLARPLGPLSKLLGESSEIPALVRRLVLAFIDAPGTAQSAPQVAEVLGESSAGEPRTAAP